MPARQLLDILTQAGLAVALTPDNALKVTPAKALTDDLRHSIKAHKAALVSYLQRTTPTTDTDRWRVPHPVAWDSKEIDTFTARLERFTDKGVTHDEAERLADGLVNRDREGDDRRLCLECVHLQGRGRWRCANAAQADVAPEALAPALVLMLQRCNGFLGAGALPKSCLPYQGGATNLPIDFGKSKPTE